MKYFLERNANPIMGKESVIRDKIPELLDINQQIPYISTEK